MQLQVVVSKIVTIKVCGLLCKMTCFPVIYSRYWKVHLYSTACGLAVVHSEGYPTIISTLANLDTFCTDHMIDC